MSARPRDLSVEPEELRSAVLEALRAEGLDAAHLDAVTAFVLDTSDVWRSCCGGFCEPCVSTLARAVDRARRTLERTS